MAAAPATVCAQVPTLAAGRPHQANGVASIACFVAKCQTPTTLPCRRRLSHLWETRVPEVRAYPQGGRQALQRGWQAAQPLLNASAGGERAFADVQAGEREVG